MDDGTYVDNPEITGRGVLCSFYIQGFLMALNGLLDIEESELMPSLVTILAISGVIFSEVIREDSAYLSLILHLLLCFHVLASHAAIVWVAEKNMSSDHGHILSQTADDLNYGEDNREQHPEDHRRLPPPWRSRYHIAQLVGAIILGASIYSISFKKYDSEDVKVMGFVGTKALSIRWYLLLTLLPCAASGLVTLLLHDCMNARKEPLSRHRQCFHLPRHLIRTILLTVWLSSLVMVVTLLESTLHGNRNYVIRPLGDSTTRWTFGQTLPLALVITPLWLFGKHILGRFKFNKPSINHVEPEAPITAIVVGDVELSEISGPPNAGNVQGKPLVENAAAKSTSFFAGATSVRITGGEFTNVNNYAAYTQAKHIRGNLTEDEDHSLPSSYTGFGDQSTASSSGTAQGKFLSIR